MPAKTVKPSAKPKAASPSSGGNIIPEISNLQAYNLINALEHPQCASVTNVFMTENGYYFHEGNDLYEMVDLDPQDPREALLIRQGKRQKRVLLPGKYIGRKRVLKGYSKEEIIECREEIIAAWAAEQKVIKARQKAEAGEDDGSAVKVITEALQKLSKNS